MGDITAEDDLHVGICKLDSARKEQQKPEYESHRDTKGLARSFHVLTMTGSILEVRFKYPGWGSCGEAVEVEN